MSSDERAARGWSQWSSGRGCGASTLWKWIKRLVRETGLSKNTIRRALRSEAPPRYQRAARAGVLEPFKPEIHRLLKDDPKLTGVRVRELLEPLGCAAGKTVVDAGVAVRARKRLTNRLTRPANLASRKLRQNHKSPANQNLAEPRRSLS